MGLSRGPELRVGVVSGLPRAGTSMLMQMLEAGGFALRTDGLRAPDVDNPRGYYELDAVKRLSRDASFLQDTVGRVVKIVAPLLRFLPGDYDYAVVFIERPLPEVLASQQAMLARSTTQGGASEPRDAAVESALARAFEASLRESRALLARRPNCAVSYVSHAQTLASPRRVAAEILDFFDDHGGPWPLEAGRGGERPPREERIERMAAVVDPSLCRAPRPAPRVERRGDP